ncbi:MAG: ergothioneine biosynthesis glutamate--cysteine ligase EgtA, partial [Marmoricola sp.]|nr:ergothioneine biosynthesis glutamate--cysteine ligase EgtA [Marmoricola sp.]
WPEAALDDPLVSAADPVEAARDRVAQTALHADAGGRVGLELEYHLVDLARPTRRPTWTDVLGLSAGLPAMPRGSTVTFEPGGQIELSTPPAVGVVEAVAALREDEQRLRTHLREAGYGTAALGADLARAPQRVNPHPRYQAMEQHFDALGCAGSGREMMTATAALQVNLDAGPEAGWDDRLALVRTMVPMLVALSSTSPWLGGRTSGWHSMRQGTWQGIDHHRSDPVARGEPTRAWAVYALDAPVMLLRPDDPGAAYVPVTERIPFAQWLRGGAPFGRPPTTADLDYHLTTLFPPVRPRGYVELRCLDALPTRWWPAMAAIVATLADDAGAASAAAELCGPVADSWETAARHGLDDPAVRRAVTGCVDVALRHVPAELASEVETVASLLEAGSSPSRELRRRVEAVGPLAVLEEESRG